MRHCRAGQAREEEDVILTTLEALLYGATAGCGDATETASGFIAFVHARVGKVNQSQLNQVHNTTPRRRNACNVAKHNNRIIVIIIIDMRRHDITPENAPWKG